MLLRLGAHGGSLRFLNCLWTFLLHMALVFQFGQPARAQPLPGLCPGSLIRTGSCGKCVCLVFLLLLLFVKVVAGRVKRPQEKSFLSCSVLLRQLSLDLGWEMAILSY